MNDEALIRFSRHILLPEIETEGQQAFLDARVLVVGAGGLGSPVVLYLAAAGVGHLTVADGDSVELSNLQRQIVHSEQSQGQNKADSACIQARSLNKDSVCLPFTQAITADNVNALVVDHDVVIDCSDNFSTRFLLNDACVAVGKPLISGAAIRWEGHLSVFAPVAGGGCYRCLYPEQGEDEQSCTQNGVMGPLVGIIGSWQALEALKWLAGQRAGVGRLNVFDGLSGQWRQFRLPADPDCACCGGGAESG